jgi:hypothetical protein
MCCYIYERNTSLEGVGFAVVLSYIDIIKH